METENKVYKKIGKRYKPIGEIYDRDWLTDGIWFVHSKPGCRSITNVDRYLSGVYKVGDAQDKYVDIPKLCSIDNYVNYVLNSKEFNEIVDSGHYNLYELTAKITALIVDLNDQINKSDTVPDNLKEIKCTKRK